MEVYSSTLEKTDTWRQYMRSQTEEATADIWEDAKPVMEEFLNDVR